MPNPNLERNAQPLKLILYAFLFQILAKAQFTGRNRGIVQPSKPPVFPHLNPYFRHSSLSFTGNSDVKTWSLLPKVDWTSKDGKNVVGPPKDQGNCGSCWALSAVGSLESACALAFGSTKPDISSQQLINCVGKGMVSSCKGGLPADAFEYIAKETSKGHGGLMSSSQYPYVGFSKTNNNCLLKSKGSYGISMYESTDFSGWFGYFLALQSQPIVVFIQADYPTFINFQGAGIYDDPNCYSSIVNHAVLMTGYDLTSNPPTWTIRNSWGSSWGVNGFMNIAIRGGDGICGIQSNPGMYPVVAGNAPCSGKINPCGGGSCVPNFAQNAYSCICVSGFISKKSRDGSATCIPRQACGFFIANPCNYGTCVDDMQGGYSCMCPFGFSEGQRHDGRPTCVPSKKPNSLYKINTGASCTMILSQFGITEKKLKLKNKGLDCKKLKKGLSIDVSSGVSCSLYFSSKKDYSCASVVQTFGLTQTEFSNLNPSLRCSSPIPKFVQVCVKGGTRNGILIPTQTYSLQPGDTCQSVMNSFGISTVDFYNLNPGIFCDQLILNTGYSSPGQLVFVNGEVGGTYCAYGTYTARTADTWSRIIYMYFDSSIKMFKKYNTIAVTSSTLYVGLDICLPP